MLFLRVMADPLRGETRNAGIVIRRADDWFVSRFMGEDDFSVGRSVSRYNGPPAWIVDESVRLAYTNVVTKIRLAFSKYGVDAIAWNVSKYRGECVSLCPGFSRPANNVDVDVMWKELVL